jgi:hypothetical protein
MLVIKRILCLFIILLCMLKLTAQDHPKASETFNWREYNAGSMFPEDSINYELLFGNWISREYRLYGNYPNMREIGSNSNIASMEIKSDKYRKTLSGKFYPFEIAGNRIVFHTDVLPDTGYINSFTGREMLISFKYEDGIKQYLYKK